ncbi:MAG: glycoside hydrolase family 28 protein [Bacteroidales bacterium]|nr:glycoside hydrolase family 28 protein [Bacteroidales bacterium]MCF8389931.1 glycoside hydrolase family 28 protein [Bacteroidales bacterium]
MKQLLNYFLICILLLGQFSCNNSSEDKSNRVHYEIPVLPADMPFSFKMFDLPSIPSKEYNIVDFGALEGASVNVSQAIHSAIKKAHKSGGGRIIIPDGKWLSGPIHLESHIELHISDNAEVFFSQNLFEYLPAVLSRHQGIECYKFSPLIHAEGKTDIVISGKGKFHGQGKAWWKYNKYREKAWSKLILMADNEVPVENRIFNDTSENYLPPSFLQFVNCKNILIDGISLNYGPFWTLNPLYCENIIIRNVNVETIGEYGHTRNGDGINPSSCRNVIIENCIVNSGDDCFTIKSGRNIDGIRVGKPSENIIINNCIALKGHGGVVIGSETSGGIRNILVSNCEFYGTDRGIRIKTARGRGAGVENIFFRDIYMKDILYEGVIVNMLRYTPRLPAFPLDSLTPFYNNIHIERLVAENIHGKGISLVGLPENPMKNIFFDDININSYEGMCALDADSVFVNKLILSNEKSPSIVLDSCRNFWFSESTFPRGAIHIEVNQNCSNINFENCN